MDDLYQINSLKLAGSETSAMCYRCSTTNRSFPNPYRTPHRSRSKWNPIFVLVLGYNGVIQAIDSCREILKLSLVEPIND